MVHSREALQKVIFSRGKKPAPPATVGFPHWKRLWMLFAGMIGHPPLHAHSRFGIIGHHCSENPLPCLASFHRSPQNHTSKYACKFLVTRSRSEVGINSPITVMCHSSIFASVGRYSLRWTAAFMQLIKLSGNMEFWTVLC